MYAICRFGQYLMGFVGSQWSLGSIYASSTAWESVISRIAISFYQFIFYNSQILFYLICPSHYISCLTFIYVCFLILFFCL